jgi:hypothetical protein
MWAMIEKLRILLWSMAGRARIVAVTPFSLDLDGFRPRPRRVRGSIGARGAGNPCGNAYREYVARGVTIVVAALAALVLACSASAAGVLLKPAHLYALDHSKITGMATLTPVGLGTSAHLVVNGLGPHSPARALLHEGTCTHHGPSTATVGFGRADGTGVLRTTTAQILSRSLPLAVQEIADGKHVIAVSVGARVVACGRVPRERVPRSAHRRKR